MQNTCALIGKRIKECRKRAGLTQQNLADQLNCSTSFISRLETGSSMTSVEGLIEISAALQTPISSFFVDFECSADPESVMDPRLRSLFYQLSMLDEKSRDYVLECIERFLAFTRQ